MSARTPEVQAALDAEARRRVRQALRQIEEAQGQLNSACATLSSLCYAMPEWKATSALADRVKAHWYRVRNALELGPKSRKVCLDRLAADNMIARTARPAPEARP